ncbi:MAG TPA: phosphoribosylformylglycinamidine synthase subunit PurQ [Pirellulales bacterium]
MQPRILILRAPGTNCDAETAHAFQLAGGQTDVLHVRRLLGAPRLLADYQVFCIPGGFSYGDDIASGRIFGIQLQNRLAEVMQEFKDAGKLILGICNGFQVLVKCGLLSPDDPKSDPAMTLAWNTSGKFEARWVNLAVDGNRCVLLTGIESMYVPIKHGEGRFVARDATTLAELDRRGQLALRYSAPQLGELASDGAECDLARPLPYPENPNGAQANVAGVCDPTGRILGLMPHPELHVDPQHHPRWSRGEAGKTGDGLLLFQNAVAYFR